MAENIYGTNSLRKPMGLSLVSVYITKAQCFYKNPFTHSGIIAPDDDFFGFIHTTRGEGIIYHNGQTVTVHENEIIFMRYSDVQGLYTNNNEWDFYCLWFFLSSDAPHFFQPYPLDELKDERRIILEIIRLLNCNDEHYLVQANGLGVYLLGQIQSQLNIHSAHSPYHTMIHKSILYINQNINQPITVKELAQMNHVSEKHFRYLFCQETSVSPKHYIITAKLNKAAHMLTLDMLSIAEISDALSFPSSSYFISAFKKQFGQTPSAYRKSHYFNTTH